jgi:hypothetical protein
MVPYLGILFVPFALAISGFGLTRSGSRDRRRFLNCAGITLGILAIQLFLWWLLYIIPETAI